MLKVVNRATGDKLVVYWIIFENMHVFRKKSFVFCKWIYPLTLKVKELASNTHSTFSADHRLADHSADHRLAAVSFLFLNAAWISLSVKASTCSFGRPVKRIEISKARPETSLFVPFHKIGFTASFQKFRAKEDAFSSLLNSQPIRSHFPTVVATSTLLNCCTWEATSGQPSKLRPF